MKNKIVLIILLLSIFVIYYITSAGNTPYNYFIKLAEAFLNGRYYLVDNPPWLNELIPISGGRFAIVYPPAPSIIAMPLVYFFGNDFPQEYIAHALGAGMAILTAKIAFTKSRKVKLFAWILALAAFGNIQWYLASSGSVWYLGQISGSFFLTATIYESIKNKRPMLVSLFFAMAILSRFQLILAIPLIVYLNWRKLDLIKALGYSLPIGVLGMALLYYNYIRFGSMFETGYSLIPGVLDEPWYSKGIFDLSYIPNSLRVMFLSLPIFTNEFPFIKPSWGGLSILITTPAFIYILFTKLRNIENLTTVISLLLIALVSLSHGGTGFTQFGYRYAVDFYPLIFYLLIIHLKDRSVKWHHVLLLVLSIIINLWGVLWINKFGWVSF